MLAGINRILENDDVAMLNMTIRHEGVPEPSAAIAQFVHQKVVADKQGVLHGFRRNLEGLHDESDDENRDDNGRQQRNHRTHPVRMDWFSFCLRRCLGHLHRTRDYGSARVRLPIAGDSAPAGKAAKYSRTCRAASCSAFFLVEPSARPTNSGVPRASSAFSLASTVNVLRCSGPCSFTKT